MKKKEGANLRSLAWLFGMSIILLGSLMLLPCANAKDWPTKPITVVVGMPPGGLASTTARVVVNEMSKTLGVPIVVVDMGGGGGGSEQKKFSVHQTMVIPGTARELR